MTSYYLAEGGKMAVPFRGSGKIKYAEKEYKCRLYYDENQEGIVLQVLIQTEIGFGDYLEFPFEPIPVVYGKLDSGMQFALLNVRRGGQTDNIGANGGITEYKLYPEYLIEGVYAENNIVPTFNTVRFILSDIVEWGEKTIYSVGENYELKRNDSDSKILLLDNDEYVIEYRVKGSFLPCSEYELLKENIILTQYGELSVIFKTEQPFQKFLDIFRLASKLIELSMLRHVNIEKVYAYSKNYVDEYEGGHTSEKNLKVYGLNIKSMPDGYEKSGPHRFNWITLGKLIDNNSFKYFFDKYEKLAPIIELFSDVLRDGSLTKKYLNVVQALETYHSRFVTNDLKTYKKRIERMVKELPSNNAAFLKKVLLANSKYFITLESRIADLVYAEGKRVFDTGEVKFDEFPGVVARTRNYYIHYDEKIKEKGIFSDEELDIYTRALLIVLEYYILSEIGFNVEDSFINNVLNGRWGRISQDINIKVASKKRHSVNS